MRNLIRGLSVLLMMSFASMAIMPSASLASVEGKRNTAIGLTAGAIVAGVSGKKTAAIGLGAGAAYAWKRHSDARKNQAYHRGYTRGYHRGYHRGYRNAGSHYSVRHHARYARSRY